MSDALSRDAFWRRSQPYVRDRGFDYAIMRVSPSEFATAVSRKVKLVAVPIIFTEIRGATYFWPRKPRNCEIKWEWAFDKEHWDAYCRYRFELERRQKEVKADE